MAVFGRGGGGFFGITGDGGLSLLFKFMFSFICLGDITALEGFFGGILGNPGTDTGFFWF